MASLALRQELGLVTTQQSELLVAQLIGAGAIIGYISSTAFVYFWIVLFHNKITSKNKIFTCLVW